MSEVDATTIARPSLCLPLARVRSVLFMAVLISGAVLLPVVSHLSGLSVRTLVPMHWPVLLAGLVYGWRGGAIIGLLSPVISYAFSGMPFPPMIPIMSAELAAYGLVGGLLRERFRLNGMIALAVALIAGRLVYVASFLMLQPFSLSGLNASLAGLLPGWIAALGQILILPPLASWWVRSARK